MLKENLTKILKETNLTVPELERRAGIKPYSLRNIVQGKSTNPSVEIVFAIAKELGYTMEELLSSSISHKSNKSEAKNNESSVRIFNHIKFDKNLLSEIHDFLLNHFQNLDELNFYQYISGLSDIYQYCFEQNNMLFDIRYANWWLKRNLGY
jgi:transcriptional regulator with XRE-family HTH domain